MYNAEHQCPVLCMQERSIRCGRQGPEFGGQSRDAAAGGSSRASCTATLPSDRPLCRCSTASGTDSSPEKRRGSICGHRANAVSWRGFRAALKEQRQHPSAACSGDWQQRQRAAVRYTPAHAACRPAGAPTGGAGAAATPWHSVAGKSPGGRGSEHRGELLAPSLALQRAQAALTGEKPKPTQLTADSCPKHASPKHASPHLQRGALPQQLLGNAGVLACCPALGILRHRRRVAAGGTRWLQPWPKPSQLGLQSCCQAVAPTGTSACPATLPHTPATSCR